MEEALRRALSGNKKEHHWAPMSTDPPPFSPVVSSAPPKSLQGALLNPACVQMPLSQCLTPSTTEGSNIIPQRDSISYRFKSSAAERLRRHSVDGSPMGSDSGKDKGFHCYERQYSEGATTEAFSYCWLRECQQPDSLNPALSGTVEQEEQLWSLTCPKGETSVYMGAEETPAETRSRPAELPSYSSSTCHAYSTLSALQQPCLGEYLLGRSERSSHNSYQKLSTQASQDCPVQTLYPKPIYSYSILIFMALRNSRTGSLPVSEIYSFMTEHFPYFKTAPDGWKNSVRHNLSLNKCFEKVENKNGNASRKGCLWALNPTKVEKMQEELHKWRRKDPGMVRRSMARPEELDHLLGERPQRQKSLYTHLNKHIYPQFPRVTYSSASSLRPPDCNQYNPSTQTVPRQHAFSFYPPLTQQTSTCLPHRTHSLESLTPVHTPQSYSVTLQACHSAAGSMQELLMDGELNSDIDTLNPSLTDLQLHGYLWEELRNDSLAPEPLVMDTSISPNQLSPNLTEESVESCGSGNGEVADLQTHIPELHLAGLYSTSFSSADSMTGLHSAPTNTPVPLL